MPKQKLFSKFLHEPLFHFLLIGLGLFVLFFQLNPNEESSDTTNIVITQAKVDAMTVAYVTQRGRKPLPYEMQELIENEIREELLYREAMALGLDKDDGVIRRRLAQKMKYLFEDLAVIYEPTDAELEKYLNEHAEKYTIPSTLSFYQVYLDPKKHDNNLEETSKMLVESLKSTSLENTFTLGDRSFLKYHFTKRRENDVINRLGKDFSKNLFKAPIDSWQGPFESAYGIHFVYITEKNEASLPELKEVREDVLQAYKMEKASEANELFYKALKTRYKITVDESVLKDTNISIAL